MKEEQAATQSPFPVEEERERPQSETEPAMPAPEPDLDDAARGKQILADAIKMTMDQGIARELQGLQAQREKFKFLQQIAKLFAASGLFEELKNVTMEQAIARAMIKILLGEAAGLTPMESMKSIYLTPGGRPEMDAQIRAARMKRHGYDWRFIQHDSKGCVIEIWKDGAPIPGPDGKPSIVSFTEADALQVKVYRRDKSVTTLLESNPTYKSYPRNMYFSRAVTNAQRWFAPEVLNGVSFLDATEREEAEPAEAVKRPVFKEEKSGK